MIALHLISVLLLVATVALKIDAEPYDRDVVFEGAIDQVISASKLDQYYKSLGEVLGNKNKQIVDEVDIYEVVGQVKRIFQEWESSFILSKLLNQKPSEEAIELFSSLPSGIVQCDFRGYLILASNYAAAIGDLRHLNPTDQIKSSVRAAIQEHGIICGGEYFQRFMDKYNGMSPEVMDGLKLLLNCELLDKIFAKDLKSALRTTNLLAKFKSSWGSALLDRIASVVDGGQEAKYLRSVPSGASLEGKKSEFEVNIVDRYLIKPCRSFVFEFNDILEPAKLDLTLGDSFITVINPNHSVLLRDTWKRYLVCNMVNLNFSMVTRELISLARKKL